MSELGDCVAVSQSLAEPEGESSGEDVTGSSRPQQGEFTLHHIVKQGQANPSLAVVTEGFYACSHCLIDFPCPVLLKRHLTSKHNMADKIDVSSVLASTLGLDQVQTGFATGGKAHKCEHCSASCSQANLEEKQFMCDICFATFSQSGYLQKHKKVHLGLRPYKCQMCDAAFSLKCNLQTHTRTHTGERPYSCEECNSAFAHMSSLQRHKRIHTGEKPYKCEVCGATFNQNGNLQTHRKTHTKDQMEMEDKPFRCDMCSAAFLRVSHLQSHILIHTGERNFKCDVCNSAFKHISNLHRHRKIHTKDKPFICGICCAAFMRVNQLKSHIALHMEAPSDMAATDGSESSGSAGKSISEKKKSRPGPY